MGTCQLPTGGQGCGRLSVGPIAEPGSKQCPQPFWTPSWSWVSPKSRGTRPRVLPTPERGQNEAEARPHGVQPTQPRSPWIPRGVCRTWGCRATLWEGAPAPQRVQVSSHARPQGGGWAGQVQEGILGDPSDVPNIWTGKVGHTGLPGQVRNGGCRKAYGGEWCPPKLVSAGNLRMWSPWKQDLCRWTWLRRGRPGLTA